MVKVKHVILAAICILILALGITCLLPSEEKKIKQQFVRLSKYAKKKHAESALVGAGKAHSIAQFMTDSCELNTDIPFLGGTYSRPEATMVASRIRAQFNTMTLNFYDLSIEICEDTTAKVTLTAKLSGQTTGGDHISEIRELDCVLLKVDKKWFFDKWTVVEVLQN